MRRCNNSHMRRRTLGAHYACQDKGQAENKPPKNPSRVIDTCWVGVGGLSRRILDEYRLLTMADKAFSGFILYTPSTISLAIKADTASGSVNH